MLKVGAPTGEEGTLTTNTLWAGTMPTVNDMVTWDQVISYNIVIECSTT